MSGSLPRIVNKTRYRTDDLRRFFRAGLEAMGASIEKTVHVHEIGGKLRRHRTWGRLGSFDADSPREGGVVSMGLSREDPLLGAYGRTTAGVFHHEVLHNLGLRHSDMA